MSRVLAAKIPTTGQWAALRVDPATGALLVDLANALALPTESAASASTTAFSVAGSSATVLAAADANRLGVMVYNDTTVNLLLAFGSTVSTSSFGVVVPSKVLYEVPKAFAKVLVSGILEGSTSSGIVRVTEGS